jgi:hypothetical protein
MWWCRSQLTCCFVLKALLGAVVLTRYNNKCYKVDDIDWEMSPGSKFVDYNGEEKSFIDHYKKHFGITIKDKKQPMLIDRAKRHTAEEAVVAQLIALVPELCALTGLRGHWEVTGCDRGGEAQDNQEVLHQADAWQEDCDHGKRFQLTLTRFSTREDSRRIREDGSRPSQKRKTPVTDKMTEYAMTKTRSS